MNQNRGGIDTALANMFSSRTYANNYLFYAHMIGQCKIVLDYNMPAPAGVAFKIDVYTLYINPTSFDKFPLIHQLGVLKHEMEHILNDHVHRKEDRNHLAFNYAADCAINQLIDRNHLPTGAIYPDNFPVKGKVPIKMHAEYYYDLLKEQHEEDQECSACGGSGTQEDGEGAECTCERCGGTGKESASGYEGDGIGELIDDHGLWQTSDGDRDLQKDLTKQMIDNSINETVKSKGNLPQNISDMLEIFTRKPIISWKKVLKNIVGNKRVNSRRTIMRQDRRFPSREDLRGKVKDRMFELVILVDVSGSMSTEEIMIGLNEIHHICKMTKTTMKLIQIDTQVHAIEEFSEKTKLFERSGCGGTQMYPGYEYVLENKITHDALIYITDGHIEDVSKWPSQPKCKTMWLCTSPGHSIPGVASLPKHVQFDLSAA